MNYLSHAVVKDMVDAGIEPTITKDGLKIGGFYKSGEILLVPNEDHFIAKARHNEETRIESFDDLVWLNYHWWGRSKERYDGWSQPDQSWLNELIRLNLVVARTIPERIVYE